MTRWKYLALLVICAARIPAASLSAGIVSGGAGQSVNLSVALQTQGAQISGLQFDISYDKTALTMAVAAGTATSAAGKSLSTNSQATGVRVLIVGFNQTLIADGSVVNLTIAVAANAAGSYPLTVSAASGTDPSGQAVAISASSGAVTVGGASSLPALAVAKTHSGSFGPGQTGAAYTVVVSNQAGANVTSGTITVAENLPAGLTLVSMAGTGWNCAGVTCTRSDPLNGGISYPAIAVTVNVATNAPSSVTNQVTVSGGGSVSASASDVTTISSATLLTQTISFPDLNLVTFGAAPFSLTAAATSGLPVSFASTAQSVCNISGNTVTLTGIGTCSITASQAGNGTFAAASPLTRTFSVLKGSQSISFAPLANVTPGTAPITLTATTTSGLAVVFTSLTLSACTLTGNTLNLIAAGTCTVTASQPGNANYFEAPQVIRSFTVVRTDAPVVSQGGVVPVYSASTTVQAGSWISIYGTNLATKTEVWSGNFPTSLGGVSVTVNGKPGYLWFVSPAQINFQAPDDTATGSVNVVVTTPAGAFTATVTLGAASPSLSLLDSKHVAALAPNADGTYDIVGPTGAFPYATRPVAPGDALILYGVGFGPTDPPVKAGQAVTTAVVTVNPVTVVIGGVNATVAYSGIVGAGLYQINVIVPAGTPSGDQPIRASVSGLQTGAGAVVTVR